MHALELGYIKHTNCLVVHLSNLVTHLVTYASIAQTSS